MRRINLLRAHGSPGNHEYKSHGCRCAPCRAARAESARNLRLANPGRSAAYTKRWRETHLEQALASERRSREAHREERAAYCRRYYESHRDSLAEYNRRYHAENLAGGAARTRTQRARKRNAPGTHTTQDVRAQYEHQGGKCYWRRVNHECAVNLQSGYHVDHVIPLAGERTSSNGPENLVLACRSCNQRKADKDPMDWAGVLF